MRVDLLHLNKIGLIYFYKNGGEDFIEHPNWLVYQYIQKPQESNYPTYNGEGSERYDSGKVAVSPNRIEKNRIEKNIYKSNVLLATEEYDKLLKKLGKGETERWVEKLSDYMLSKGKKYKSHYHTILNWVRMEEEKTGRRISIKKNHCVYCGKESEDSVCEDCLKERSR